MWSKGNKDPKLSNRGVRVLRAPTWKCASVHQSHGVLWAPVPSCMVNWCRISLPASSTVSRISVAAVSAFSWRCDSIVAIHVQMGHYLIKCDTYLCFVMHWSLPYSWTRETRIWLCPASVVHLLSVVCSPSCYFYFLLFCVTRICWTMRFDRKWLLGAFLLTRKEYCIAKTSLGMTAWAYTMNTKFLRARCAIQSGVRPLDCCIHQVHFSIFMLSAAREEQKNAQS